MKQSLKTLIPWMCGIFLITDLFAADTAGQGPASPGAASVETESSAQAALYFQEANRAIQEHRLEEAETLLKEAARLHPSHYQYHFELSNLYLARFDGIEHQSTHPLARETFERAMNELERVQMLKPDFVAAYFNLGILKKKIGNFEEAREEFRKALRLAPEDVRIPLQLGETYERQGFYEEARDLYKKTLREHPEDPQIQEALKLSYESEKQYEESRRQRDRTDQLASFQQPITAPLVGGGAADPNAQAGQPSTASGLTQLGLMLAQGLFSRGSSE